MSAKLMGEVWALDLPQHEKLVALALADHGEDDGTQIYPSVARLAWKTGYSERRVQQILRSLEEKGLIDLVARATGGRGYASEYQMHTERVKPSSPFINERVQPASPITRLERVKPGVQKGETGSLKGETGSLKGETGSLKGETAIAPQPSYNHQNPSIEPSCNGAVAPSPSPAPPVPSKPVTEQQAEVGAWASVMGLDISIPANAKRIGNMLKGLRRSKVAQPTVDVAETYWTNEARASWNFYRDTWQGQRGQPPTEREINQYWGAWLKPVAKSNGHARAAPNADNRAVLERARAKYNGQPAEETLPPGIIEGKVISGAR